MTVVLIIVAFFCGMLYEHWSQNSYEKRCPRVFLGYPCKRGQCDHSWEAWEDVERRHPDKF